MSKVYVPVSVKDELPPKNGFYTCFVNNDHVFNGQTWFNYETGFQESAVTHWLKAVELPSDKTIRQEAAKYPQITASGFVVGAKYILNLLTPNNNDLHSWNS